MKHLLVRGYDCRFLISVCNVKVHFWLTLPGHTARKTTPSSYKSLWNQIRYVLSPFQVWLLEWYYSASFLRKLFNLMTLRKLFNQRLRNMEYLGQNCALTSWWTIRVCKVIEAIFEEIMPFIILGVNFRMILSSFLPRDTFQPHDALKGILPTWKRAEAVRMLLPGHTAGKTTPSSYKSDATGSTRKRIRTVKITVPEWWNDFAHVWKIPSVSSWVLHIL